MIVSNRVIRSVDVCQDMRYLCKPLSENVVGEVTRNEVSGDGLRFSKPPTGRAFNRALGSRGEVIVEGLELVVGHRGSRSGYRKKPCRTTHGSGGSRMV